MRTKVAQDLSLLETGLEVLQEAALTGSVTVVVIDQVKGTLTGDLPTLLVKMKDALYRLRTDLSR